MMASNCNTGMKHLTILLAGLLLLLSRHSIAQLVPTLLPDSILTHQLPEASVRAFDLNSDALQVPASIGIIDSNLLRLQGNASIAGALNSLPGVRMDERSPGSYRLALRGSSLRAPFGVRNVKVYYNGIPFTDPGGGTYLTQLGYYNFSRIELIKGPGSSMYGAGTGGVMLIESIPDNLQSAVGVEVTTGSYGLVNAMAELSTADSAGMNSIFRYQHLSSDGYRDHSALRKDVVSWDGKIALAKNTSLSTHLFFTDLQYETPGALTLAEYEANPRAARPGSGAVLSPDAAGAGVAQKAFLAGATLQHVLSANWSFDGTLYGAFTAQDNPTIRNYSLSSEPHAGGRATLKYHKLLVDGSIEWLMGAEGQQGQTSTQTYSNKGGIADTLQADDRVNTQATFGFTQLAMNWKNWLLTAGLSINSSQLKYARLSVPQSTKSSHSFNNEAAPRLAISYKLRGAHIVYASASRGFSPPTSTELSPSGGQLNTSLNAEHGWAYEAGVRGELPGKKLSYGLCAYYFGLNNTIVQRRDSAGGDYYINSGSTQQTGMEVTLRYIATSGRNGKAFAYLSGSFQHYRYNEFVQVENDYSGKEMPGVAPITLAGGAGWESRLGLYARLSCYYLSGMQLNDANKASLPSYSLLGLRMGYKANFRAVAAEAFAGVENIADVQYSAGADINGFGARYYNAAPGRNYYVGLAFHCFRNRKSASMD
jgi:iron complex outermembrane receptor protein